MSRIVLLTNSTNHDQQNLITLSITAHNAAWWHWFPTAWIINDPNNRDLAEWADIIRMTSATFVYLLIDLDDPSRPPIGYLKPEWYEWITSHWPPQPPSS
jgi:hypothetical protein